jgi:hypothetical protein
VEGEEEYDFTYDRLLRRQSLGVDLAVCLM